METDTLVAMQEEMERLDHGPVPDIPWLYHYYKPSETEIK